MDIAQEKMQCITNSFVDHTTVSNFHIKSESTISMVEQDNINNNSEDISESCFMSILVNLTKSLNGIECSIYEYNGDIHVNDICKQDMGTTLKKLLDNSICVSRIIFSRNSHYDLVVYSETFELFSIDYYEKIIGLILTLNSSKDFNHALTFQNSILTIENVSNSVLTKLVTFIKFLNNRSPDMIKSSICGFDIMYGNVTKIDEYKSRIFSPVKMGRSLFQITNKPVRFKSQHISTPSPSSSIVSQRPVGRPRKISSTSPTFSKKDHVSAEAESLIKRKRGRPKSRTIILNKRLSNSSSQNISGEPCMKRPRGRPRKSLQTSYSGGSDRRNGISVQPSEPNDEASPNCENWESENECTRESKNTTEAMDQSNVKTDDSNQDSENIDELNPENKILEKLDEENDESPLENDESPRENENLIDTNHDHSSLEAEIPIFKSTEHIDKAGLFSV